VDQLVTQILTSASGVGAYGLVLGVLLVCGVGLPLPEDVALITGGYLVYLEAARLPYMIAVAYLGILGGDSFAFLLGRHLGGSLTQRWPFRLIITPAKRAKVERLFHRYGDKIVVAARFMPGVRAVTYFCGGAARMRYRRFILYDGAAAMISAPFFVLLGWHFGDRIDWVVREVRRGQTAVLLSLAGIICAYLVFRHLRKSAADRRDRAEEEQEAEARQQGAQKTDPPTDQRARDGEPVPAGAEVQLPRPEGKSNGAQRSNAGLVEVPAASAKLSETGKSPAAK
jgi:membrane protein DedA with SNARE-associated domain